ncbi:hypothetical protein PB2503_10609 [Parvularcula bermudensis HTCC2503]|uniref:Uncharacterized protein n=1 Tax=Parvularcula bermudensis (strain ATCC BAA-594 / HTCC2503 / KCTC 12087) TaxID=314260 RepID=E0TGP1_PARBH|nr:hypothetical protein [Parvularcula bermudensis]ADM10173.1 hypothetical protein PB2503_10609 [Parvularcula bermudensis HTCC2503]
MRTVLGLTVILALAIAVYVLVREAPTATDIEGEASSSVRIAERHEEAMAALETALDQARSHAARADKLEAQLNQAISSVRVSADNLADLAPNNQAALASADAAIVTVEEAQQAADALRRYADTAAQQLQAIEKVADDANDVAAAVTEVERSEARAQEALAEAENAQSELSSIRESVGTPTTTTNRPSPPTSTGSVTTGSVTTRGEMGPQAVSKETTAPVEGVTIITTD